MDIIWKILIIIVGLFMLISSITKSKFIIYRLLFARSKILWKENTHQFLGISGTLIIIFGILMILGIIG